MIWQLARLVLSLPPALLRELALVAIACLIFPDVDAFLGWLLLVEREMPHRGAH